MSKDNVCPKCNATLGKRCTTTKFQGKNKKRKMHIARRKVV